MYLGCDALSRLCTDARPRWLGNPEVVQVAHVPTSSPLGALGRDTTVLDPSACSRRLFQSASSAFRGTSPLASTPVCRYPAVPQKSHDSTFQLKSPSCGIITRCVWLGSYIRRFSTPQTSA